MLGFMTVLVGSLAPGVHGNKNLLLGKPSNSSPTFPHNPASFANDGDTATGCLIRSTARPFWEADLLGVYEVSRVTVRRCAGGWSKKLNNALIGVSLQGKDIYLCGMFPDVHPPKLSMVFNCSGAGPVKYVRIWREKRSHLGIREVSATGVESEQRQEETLQTDRLRLFEKLCMKRKQCLVEYFDEFKLKCRSGVNVTKRIRSP